MKSKFVARLLSAGLLLLSSGRLLIAQEAPSGPRAKHHKYKFIDLGTLGGPDSIIPFGQRILTEHGAVVGIAETDIPDPFAPNCSSPNCKVQSGFQWRKGVITKLPGLSLYGEGAAQAVNESGTVIGDSQNGLVDPVSGLPEINAVRWKHGEIENLGTLGGNSSGAISISNSELVTGWSETSILDSGFRFRHTRPTRDRCAIDEWALLYKYGCNL